MSSEDEVFRALSNSTRRLILEELADTSEQTLYELCVRLTMNHDIDMTRQGVSKHLDILEEAALVTTTRRGKYKLMSFTGAERVQSAAAWLERLSESGTETNEE